MILILLCNHDHIINGIVLVMTPTQSNTSTQSSNNVNAMTNTIQSNNTATTKASENNTINEKFSLFKSKSKRSRKVPVTSKERTQYYLDQCNTHKLSYLLDTDTLSIQDNGKVLCESCMFRFVRHIKQHGKQYQMMVQMVN